MKAIVLLAVGITLSACVSVQVERVPADVLRGMQRVCIERNPRVLVADFLSILQAGFRRHGIETAVYDAPVPIDCQFVLTYTARQSWDIVNYVKYAELTLRDGGDIVGKAEYLHGGGFAASKYASTDSKISPLVDDLLGAAPASR